MSRFGGLCVHLHEGERRQMGRCDVTDDILTINWYNGNARIYMPSFFPCNETTYKKLKKLIQLDYEHEDELLERIRKHFEIQCYIHEASFKQYGKEYLRCMEEKAKYRDLLESHNLGSGIPLKKEQVRDYKKYFNDYKKFANSALRTALKAKKDKEWYEKHLSQDWGWSQGV